MAKLPAVIGRYQVLDRIGQGGMGALYRAWDPMLERQIAIKLLRDDNEELRERFAREARSAARLRHRNIVTIFDVGEQDDQPFIAMEYIQGQTLADLIRAGAPITVPRKLQVIEELCDGLAFAHKSGIVHRDVKPANVMVEHDGSVKILDFGIVRIAESGMTQAGMLIGTLNYMSPEQIAGRAIDLRSDVFAVGAVLYELLSCKQAFPGGLHNGILNRILHEPPQPLSQFCPYLEPEIVQIVDQALAKDPAARYQDLSAMRVDLQALQARFAPPASETGARATDTDETVRLQTPSHRSYTPRRSADREDLARRRATQIAAHLEHAHQAMADGDYDLAIASAEQALLLEPDEPEALDLIDRARTALEERQLQNLLGRGEELLRSGALTEARHLAEQAVTLLPESDRALAFQETVKQAVEARDSERERAEAIRRAMDRARSQLESGTVDEAEAAIADALRLAPELPHRLSRAASAEALALQERARSLRERLEQEALARRAAAAVEAAERLFGEGRHAEALHALEGFEPRHEAVAAAFARLQQAKDRIDREQREARLRAENSASALASAEKTASHEEAIGILEQALLVDTGHAELQELLAKRRAAHEEERRRARERHEQAAAAVTKARGVRAHGDAIALLQRALELEPEHPDAARLLAERQAALQQEEEAQRRAERTAATLASARRAVSHEAAVGILEDALRRDPGQVELEPELAARRAAHEDELRQARERREKVDAAIARAKKTKSHQEAIASLEQALELEPDRADAKRLLTERRAALEREREEARRQAHEREAAVAAALAQAEAAADHEEALEILRRASRLDPTHHELRRQLEARGAALEQRRAEARRAQERAEKIAEAIATAGATQSHQAALDILRRAQALDPDHGELRKLVAGRRAALEEEQRLARERREKVDAALARARQSASHEDAIAALEHALEVEAGHAEARQLLTERRAALAREREAARQAREREAAIAAALAEAQATVGHEDALAILRRAARLDPAHGGVREQLAAREAGLEQERAERRRAEERRARLEGALASAAQAASHDVAISTLEEALRIDPQAPEIEAALVRRRAARDEELRRAEERRTQVAAAVAAAQAAGSHESAIDILQKALAIEPDDSQVQRLLRERHTALHEEREAARLAQERDTRIAAALQKADAAASHEKAVVILERALGRDPGDSRLQTALAERAAARDREREEIRQAKERDAKLAAAVRQAKRTASHDEALSILAEALRLDPEHREARALQATREAALERQRAEATRLEEIASVRRAVDALIARQQFDEAAAALQHAGASLQAGKALKDLERRLTKARAAHGRPEGEPAAGGSAAISRLTARVPARALAAAATVIIAVVAAVLLATRTPSPTSQSAADPNANAPISSGTPGDVPATADPRVADATRPDPGTDQQEQTAASEASPAAPAAAPPPEPAEPEPAKAATPNPAALAAVRQGRQQISAGNLRQALNTLSAGLKADPQNAQLRELQADIVARSREQATSAREAAARHGDAATNLSVFREGSSRLDEAAQHARAGRHTQAANLLWAATGLFEKAETEAREALARAAAAPPEPAPRPVEDPPARPAPPKPTPPTTTADPPASKPPATPPVSADPGPAAQTAADKEAIQATLRAYEQAYSNLDAAAVRRIFPSINASALARSFRDLRAQEVRITVQQISISGNTATVLCDVYQSITPRAGSGVDGTRRDEFRLQKEGGRWIIVTRQGG